ncbi:MAG: aminotransferase class I/II-fold pyridoxal phosphate-dependent enzyme [Lachnospiraceae bacterium]|nr:aminotransferase class I/II-fold pyridoxal phosphate-dependent enzyme [Lachnospiraceae bacterium]
MKHGGDIYRNKVDIDFSVNLNPLGIPEEIRDAAFRSLKKADRYPDPYQEEMRREVGKILGISCENVFPGCGASELIMACVNAVKPRKALLFEPCFSGFVHALKASGCEIISHALSEGSGYSITKEDLRAMEPDIDLVFVCDPLNPSGKNIEDGVLYELIGTARENRTAVILDESFFPMSDKALNEIFSSDRSRRLLERYDDIFIIRSLTKILAVPGIRAGYVLSSPSDIRKVTGQLPEWNLPVTSEAVIKEGVRLIAETDLVEKTLVLIQTERRYLSDALKELCFEVIDSDTSYILFKGQEDLFERLLYKGILIRDCSDYGGLKKGWYRIAVRNRKDNEVLIKTLKEDR